MARLLAHQNNFYTKSQLFHFSSTNWRKKHLSWQCVVETGKNVTKTSSYLPWRKYKPNRTLFFTIFKYIGTRKLKSHPIQVKVTKIVLSPQVTLTIYILWTILSIKLCSFLTKSVGRSLSDLFSLVPQIGTQSVLSRFVLSYLQFPLETSTQNTFPWHVRRCVWPNVSYLTVHRSIDPQGNPSPCCLNDNMFQQLPWFQQQQWWPCSATMRACAPHCAAF